MTASKDRSQILSQSQRPWPSSPATSAVLSSSLVLWPHTIPGTSLNEFIILASICYFNGPEHPPLTLHLAPARLLSPGLPVPGSHPWPPKQNSAFPASTLPHACTVFVPWTALPLCLHASLMSHLRIRFLIILVYSASSMVPDKCLWSEWMNEWICLLSCSFTYQLDVCTHCPLGL